MKCKQSEKGVNKGENSKANCSRFSFNLCAPVCLVASKTTRDHSLNDMLSPVVLRIRVPDRDVNFLAVV